MNTSIVLDKELRLAAEAASLSQKEVAKRAYMAHSTTNGHFNGYPVPVEGTIVYSELFNDHNLTFAMSQELLGLMGLADGCRVKKDALALTALQKREERERKRFEEEKEIDCILATPEAELTNDQKNDLLSHCFEYSDEILFEISQLCSQLEIIGLSFMDLVKDRLPYWKKQKWID